MADLPTPTPPPPITGYRSRAINAAVNYTTASRPLAGAGVSISDGVGGKTISVDLAAQAGRALPWQVRAYPKRDNGSATAVEWKARVFAGAAMIGGVQLSAPSGEGGTDAATGLKWYEAPAFSSGNPWLCVARSGSSWYLAWSSTAIGVTSGEEFRAIAHLEATTPTPKLTQVDLGVVDLGLGGGGGGTTGYTGIVYVVSSVDWDSGYNKFTKTVTPWSFTNGLLDTQNPGAPVTTDIVAATPEMP